MGGTGPLLDGSFKQKAPQIILRNSLGGYDPNDMLYFLADGDYRGPTDYDPAWVDKNGAMTTKKIDLAQGFWIYDPYNDSTASYTIAGQVHGESFQAEYKTADGYDLASNPFPAALNPNTDVIWDGMDDAPLYSGEFKQTAPQIIIRNANGAYDPTDTLYYLADGDYRGPTDYDPGWVDKNGALVTTAKIPAGAGFWFYKGTKVKGTVTATFKKP